MASVVILGILGVAVSVALWLLAADPEAGGGGSDRTKRNSHDPHVGQ